MTEQWKYNILKRLAHRKDSQHTPFVNLVKSHAKLLESSTIAKIKNSELEHQCYQYKQEILEIQRKISVGSVEQGPGDKLLEQKIFRLQEELTELHRTRGENADQILRLTGVVKEREEQLSEKEAQILDGHNNLEALQREAKQLQGVVYELEATNQTIKDEFQALQILYYSTEEKFRKSQEENTALISRWLALKAEDADRINLENQLDATVRQQKLKEQLEEAAKEPLNQSNQSPKSPNSTVSSSVSNGSALFEPACAEMTVVTPAFVCVTTIPDKPKTVYTGSYTDAHDGEVTALRFSTSGKHFATGSVDRKVKIWETGRVGSCREVATLTGCGQSIMCVRFDLQEKLILAASNDQACRIWSFHDQRIRHTLTGHTGKVLAAKFLGTDSSKITSGSHDRTLKIWDLRSKVCTKTIFAGSSCNDLVTSDMAGTSIISAHFDKKIRFWDIRSDQTVNELQLHGKVTSLDLSPDMNYLLTCARDDSLKLIDLRMNQVVSTYKTEGFKVAFDYTRAVFSPDAQFVACGSYDGGVYIWNIKTNLMETVLREHKSSVISVAWHPTGTSILSSDRNKQLILWTEF